jgi:DNA (cytosine-5)-methyltransferase 1
MSRTAISLFAGVGGFDIALRNNGYKVIASVEIDKQCNKVLEQHFPDTKRYTDIKEVKGKDLINDGFKATKGIITGGFPCQDLSVAGKRAGLTGSRSGLYWEAHRLLDETKSETFILENVPGLLSSNGGKDFGIVLGSLVELGYSVGWRVLDAQHFGVPQRRRRVFIVGSRLGEEGIIKVLFERGSVSGNTTQSKPQGQDTTREVAESFGESSFGQYQQGKVSTLKASGGVLSGGSENFIVVFKPHQQDGARIQTDVINTLTAQMGTGGNNVPMVAKAYDEFNDNISDTHHTLRSGTKQSTGVVTDKQVRRLTPKECERLQGFPDDWTSTMADSNRYKQMGNAVAVPVVDWLVKGFNE